MSNEILLFNQVVRLKWIPEPLSHEFFDEVLKQYDAFQEVGLPDIHDITWALRDSIMLKAGSYYETNGKSTTYWSDQLAGIRDVDEHNGKYYAITDNYFDAVFHDVVILLKQLNLSHCCYDNRKHVYHYCGEVW